MSLLRVDRVMETELLCACEFISRILVSRHLPVQFIKPFSQRLEELLAEKYRNHWHPENPRKGSAFRCIRINGKMDPVIKEAAKVTGLSNIATYLPKEFTMWIDPNEVSYRFGEDGSISQCPLHPKENENFPFSATVSSGWDSRSHSPPQHPNFYDMFSSSLNPSSLSMDYKTPISVRV